MTILILQFRPNDFAHHVVPSWKKSNAGDVVIVAVQSLQALVGVEVPELHRHVRAAACEHFTLLVQTHVLKIKKTLLFRLCDSSTPLIKNGNTLS